MQVIKRNGKLENVSFDKIFIRIADISLDLDINAYDIAKETINKLYDNVKTSELDIFAAELSVQKSLYNPDYAMLAARLEISNHQKNVNTISFSEKMLSIMNIMNYEFINQVKLNFDIYDSYIDYKRDYFINYQGFRTLMKGYLLKNNKNEIIETPQDMYMRIAVALHGSNIDLVKNTYDELSLGYFTHATPTLFNAGTKQGNLLSCFLLGTDDSVEGLYKTISDSAKISAYAGGIGIHISNIRAKDSIIHSTQGKSTGIVPYIKILNESVKHITQSGKRKGSIAIYIEPWHAEILSFLDLKKNHGDLSNRALDLFYALWIPDLFMKRIQNNEMWSLMCPSECPGLSNVHSEEFETLYLQYEREHKYREQISAKDLYNRIIISQIETGTPYILFKDTINQNSNQKNIGTIKSSNLCSEIVEYSDSEEYACCTLASINLPKFVGTNKTIDFVKLQKTVHTIVENLNIIIDKNCYPVIETKLSNLKHRPLGIGVQGLQNMFLEMEIPFDSEEAKKINRIVFEAIYYYSIEKSIQLSKHIHISNAYDIFLGDITQNIDQYVGAYSTFIGSPFYNSQFQFDFYPECTLSGLFDWNYLRNEIKLYGIQNSLLTAIMPTASTSTILDNYECIEPLSSNIFTKKTLSGEYININKYLVNKCKELGIWNQELLQQIIYNNGSIQNIESIPNNIKELFKTSYEIKQKVLLDMAIERQWFIDQSQSLNLFWKDTDYIGVSLLYAWKHKLKTGVYYTRITTQQAQKFTIDPTICTMCSS
jgi:ribonucleoside-diphosphate reductase alpha chain